MRNILLVVAFVLAFLEPSTASSALEEACSSFAPPQIVIGCWQVLERHADENMAVETLQAYAAAGFTTFDTADIYGRSESVLGQLRSLGVTPVIHTKFVTRESDIDTAYQVNSRSTQALGGVPDLVAFHWWSYADDRYVQAAQHLTTLRDEGKLRYVAACNFDLEHLIPMVDAGVPIVSNQVQYSLLDRRPENGMLQYAKANGIRLATFGTVAGGLLSDAWLGVEPPSREQLHTVSQRMYFTPLSRWSGGDWELFQTLLMTLRAIADKHDSTIANVASAWVLRQLGPEGGWVILGVRDTRHLKEHSALLSVKVDDDDEAALRAVLDQGHPPEGCVWSHERGRA
mmetsp:Transcript_74738/g.121449  ORF Transcript_74738/g.121449 Transcript_74738/m.121449 type:complete len:343 (+) Transcript_74738:30-1058(+)